MGNINAIEASTTRKVSRLICPPLKSAVFRVSDPPLTFGMSLKFQLEHYLIVPLQKPPSPGDDEFVTIFQIEFFSNFFNNSCFNIFSTIFFFYKKWSHSQYSDILRAILMLFVTPKACVVGLKRKL